MQLEGTAKIPAPQSIVWQLVADPMVVGQCVPGLRELRPIVPGRRWLLKVAADLDSLQAIFEVELFLTSTPPPSEARLWLRGRSARSHVGASIYLAVKGGGGGASELYWSLFLQASGPLTRIDPQRLEDGFERAVREVVERLRECAADRLAETHRHWPADRVAAAS